VGPRSTPNYVHSLLTRCNTLPAAKGVLRPACRSVLRRPRAYSTSGTTGGVREPASDPTAARAGPSTRSERPTCTRSHPGPISKLTSDGSVPTDPMSQNSGWASMHRRVAEGTVRDSATPSSTGRGCRSRRLGNPRSTRSSCRWPKRTSGTPSTRAEDAPVHQVRSAPRARQAAPGALPRLFPHLGPHGPGADLSRDL